MFKGGTMSPTRREFMKGIAAVGAVVTAGSIVEAGALKDSIACSSGENDRCPYFDQPMYCKGLSKTGRPLCEE